MAEKKKKEKKSKKGASGKHSKSSEKHMVLNAKGELVSATQFTLEKT
jgi:hypothetical protein